jgi:hypothetical protein
MVTKYTDEIIAMYVAEYTPGQVCAQLGLCKSSQVQNEAHGNAVDEENNNNNNSYDLEQSPALVTDGPACVLCEFAMTILEKQIITNRTLDMVERGVEMIKAD